MTFACVDVDYRGDEAMAACLLFADWRDAAPTDRLVAHIPSVAPYEPGAFYKRELPCLLAVLSLAPSGLDAIVIDGYVWLGPDRRPGLGMHLYHALNDRVPVIGVAKTAFADTPAAEVIRGTGTNPLRVTAAGVGLADAADAIQKMHGAFRLPTLLKEVDRACRQAWPAP